MGRMTERQTGVSRRRMLTAVAASAVYAGPGKAASRPLEPYLSLRETARRIASRELSPVDLTREMLARIAAIDPVLKSYATVTADNAIGQAQAAAHEIAAGRYRGPLHGIPIGIKDLCWTKGVRTMGGLAVRRTFVPQEDATVVTRLRAAGAVMLGKLNLSEGAAAGYNPVMDVPLNPWNHDRWPGMSSSGSGVAVAAGLCFGAVGTDTGGSIRNPASANGVVGLKPTYGRVSRHGIMAMAESLDHVGPMAREVADAAILFDAMAGHDPRDPTSLDAPPANALQALSGDVRGLRVGVDRDYAFAGMGAEQARAISAALDVLSSAGATIVPVKMPDVSGVVPHLGCDLRGRDGPRACRHLPRARQRVRALPTGVPRDGRRGDARATDGSQAKARRAQHRAEPIAGDSGRHGRTGWRRPGVACHPRPPDRLARHLPSGLGECSAPQRRIHDADGSGRCSGHLLALWVLTGRPAVQHPVHCPTAWRTHPVSGRSRL
jgi:Asp-tRNA(Asn)/Glu-tRNA(Gln) amidotransferase A subunit family amidase